MMIHEQEAEEALGKWSSSKYALLDATSIGHTILRAFGPENFFTVRVRDPDGNGSFPDVGDYFYYDPDKDNLVLKAPENYQQIYLITRRAYTNPYLSYRMKFPDVWDPDKTTIYSGLERGTAGELIGWTHGKTSLVANDQCPGGTGWYHVDFAVPSDVTTMNRYMIRVGHNWWERWVNENRATHSVGATGLEQQIAGPPYTLATGPVASPTGQIRAFWEIRNNNGFPNTLELEFDDFNYAESTPSPIPGQWPLYDWQADTLLTSGTYDTGTSYRSHPVPIQGKEGITVAIRADTASVADGLKTQVLTAEGNWRTIDTYTLGANEFYYLDVNVDFPLLRVRYEPSGDGASITDAEVSVR